MGSSDGVGSEREEVVVRSRNRGEEEEDEACDEGWRQRLRQRLRDLAGAEEEKMGGEEANGEDRQRRPSWVGEDGHSGGFRQLGQGDEASVTGRKKEQRWGQGKGAEVVGITATEREWRRGSSDGWSATEAEKGEGAKERRGECERRRDRVAASLGRKTAVLAMEKKAVATGKGRRRAGEVGRRGRKARGRRYFLSLFFLLFFISFVLYIYIYIDITVRKKIHNLFNA